MLGIGSVVDGKYKLLSEIGHGGMSVVYLALNERANKTWAIKEVRKDGSNESEVVRQGLIAETEMLKKLDHPHLPSIVDVIDMDDSFLIVMDYIEGKSLDKILKHEGPQPVEKVIEWAKQLCDVLGYLHSRKQPIIYRDMKPGNVMLKPDGNVMLIDFGTAREYKEHKEGDTSWLGTRGYAAPEQFGGKGQTDGRTDIYCLGATMYHLLTGYSPSDTNFVILPLRQLNPAFAGTGIEKIVAKCCEPNALDRYQSCAELMYALEHVHEEDDATLRKRNFQWVSFVLCVAIALFAGIGMTVFKVLENGATRDIYNNYVSDAVSSSKNSENPLADYVAKYKAAIDISPSNPLAYNEFLESISQNGAIDKEEQEALQSCMNYIGKGTRKNIDYLKSANRGEYDRFIFKLAMAYYFLYEGDSKRSLGGQLFGEVVDSAYLSDQEKELAVGLSAIGNYYASLGKGRDLIVSFGNEGSYLTFWNQMVEITDGELISKTGGVNYAILLCEEMARQIANNTAQFRNEGISQAEMQSQIDKLKANLDLYSENIGYSSMSEEDRQNNALGMHLFKAFRKLEEAQDNVNLTFDTVG